MEEYGRHWKWSISIIASHTQTLEQQSSRFAPGIPATSSSRVGGHDEWKGISVMNESLRPRPNQKQPNGHCGRPYPKEIYGDGRADWKETSGRALTNSHRTLVRHYVLVLCCCWNRSAGQFLSFWQLNRPAGQRDGQTRRRRERGKKLDEMWSGSIGWLYYSFCVQRQSLLLNRYIVQQQQQQQQERTARVDGLPGCYIYYSLTARCGSSSGYRDSGQLSIGWCQNIFLFLLFFVYTANI